MDKVYIILPNPSILFLIFPSVRRVGRHSYRGAPARLRVGHDDASPPCVKRSGNAAKGITGGGGVVPGKGLHQNYDRRDRKGGGHRAKLLLSCLSQQGGAAAGTGEADVWRAV